jgi:hypothetical protein
MSRSVSDARLFDYDEQTGTAEYFHYNPDDDSFVIQTQTDIQPILELNHERFKASHGFKGEWNHVATIPDVVVQQLKADGIYDDPDRMKVWLNASENRMFRTRPGRI